MLRISGGAAAQFLRRFIRNNAAIMKTDLLSPTPVPPVKHQAGESFAEEQFRYEGADLQESAVDSGTPPEPDGELASFSAGAFVPQPPDESREPALPPVDVMPEADAPRLLDNSVLGPREPEERPANRNTEAAPEQDEDSLRQR